MVPGAKLLKNEGKWRKQKCKKNEKIKKMLDFDENWFFQKKFDPLISKKMVPGQNIPTNEEKWRKQKSKNI